MTTGSKIGLFSRFLSLCDGARRAAPSDGREKARRPQRLPGRRMHLGAQASEGFGYFHLKNGEQGEPQDHQPRQAGKGGQLEGTLERGNQGSRP